MAFNLGKLFYDEVEEENKQESSAQQNVQQSTTVVTTQQTSVQTPSASENAGNGKLSEQYAELLLSSIKERDLPGPDFSELKAAFSSEDLKQNIPDVKTRWKTAFNMMKMMDAKLTKAHILESIDVYVKVVEEELKNASAQFDKKYKETVVVKENKVKETQKRIDELREHLRQLQQEIADTEVDINDFQTDIEALCKEINADNADISQKRSDLNATADAIKNSMLSDKAILTEVLPND